MARTNDSLELISVLLIDDDPTIRALMFEVLSEANYTVRLADDARSGLQSFVAHPPDVVLLDVNMPGMNGFETCQRIRKQPNGKYTPVIMVTADDSPAAIEQAFDSGATDFASKPLNLDLLLFRIQYVLRAQQTADTLREREQSLTHAQKLAGMGNWQYDLSSDQIRCCSNLQALLSLKGSMMPRTEFMSSVESGDRDRVNRLFIDLADMRSVGPLEFCWAPVTGRSLLLSMGADVLDSNYQRGARIVGVIQDQTERRRTEKQIHTLAYFDAVTGLPNRTLSNKRLVNAVEAATRDKRSMAVLFIDLDHFKRINDTWGHATGDEVLRLAAERLTSCLRSNDIVTSQTNLTSANHVTEGSVARVGGDEFVIVVPDLRDTRNASLIARRINMTMATAFNVQDTEVFIGSSVGISVFPDDATDADTLLKQADGAMYEAKRSGRNCYRFFTQDIQDRAFDQIQLETRLRHAISRDQFILEYQPKISIKTGELVGIEALVRWQDPERGVIYPSEFVPLAEETGLIVPLGQWVLETACKQARIINNVLPRDIRVAVNLSALQFRHGNLVSTVEGALDSTSLDAGLLELELTESNLLEDADAQLELLHQLKSLGIRLSIDDFGTGYSSLRYLKRFPIDALKIDQCFIREVNTSAADAAIVKSIVNLAHNLGLCVVAEGVESDEQYQFLSDHGCDEAQGYLVCKPLSISQLVAWARQFDGASPYGKDSATPDETLQSAH